MELVGRVRTQLQTMQVHVFPVQQGNTRVPQAPAQQTRVKTVNMESLQLVVQLRVQIAGQGILHLLVHLHAPAVQQENTP